MVTLRLVQLGRTLTRTLARPADLPIAAPAAVVVRVGRRPLVRRVIGLVLVVATARVLAGLWAAAVLGAAVLTGGLLVGWAAVERRMTDRLRARPVVVERGPRGPGRLDGDHVAFARGLSGLAAWYLAECEREAGR